jgi:hypothetical protein
MESPILTKNVFHKSNEAGLPEFLMVSSLHGRISILRHIKRTPQSETLWITEPLPWTLHLRMLSISRASEHRRNFGGSFDRKADMRGVNGRRVVDAVALCGKSTISEGGDVCSGQHAI